jgi:hypothetical protein
MAGEPAGRWQEVTVLPAGGARFLRPRTFGLAGQVEGTDFVTGSRKRSPFALRVVWAAIHLAWEGAL